MWAFVLIFILIIICGYYFSFPFFANSFFAKGKKEQKETEEPSRLLTFKTLKYVPHSPDKYALKLGQRKLLFNEIEFYVAHAKAGDTIVYAGSAEGFHSTAIMELFPNLNFIYYDIRDFYPKLYEYKNLKIIQKYFTNEEAQKYAGKGIIFLSDIRSGSEHDVVIEDMEWQREWCEIMKPKMAMLKFRLPWRAGKTKYFDGDIYTQPRIGPSSTETRLWTDCTKYKEYDNDEYNDRVFYFSINLRNSYYEIEDFDNLSKKIKGLDHCYDCWSEIEICKQFLKSEYSSNFSKIEDLMNYCSEKSFSSLDFPPHGLFPEIKDKKERFKKMNDYLIEDKFSTRYRLFKKAIGKSIANKQHDICYKQAKEILQNTEIKLEDLKIKADPKYKPYYSEKINDVLNKPVEKEKIDEIQYLDYSIQNIIMLIEFLTPYKGQNKTCIMILFKFYKNWEIIFSLFPSITFIIYVPHDVVDITYHKNMIINNGFLSLKYCNKFASQNVLFYSEISLFYKNANEWPDLCLKIEEIEKKYCEALKPEMALLNFSTLFSSSFSSSFSAKGEKRNEKRNEKKEHYEGELLIIPWSNKEKGLLKLKTNCKKIIEYDINKIKNQYDYFNKYHYNSYHNTISGPNIDHCYGCWRSLKVLGQHFSDPVEKLNEFINSQGISFISVIPHSLLLSESNTKKKLTQLYSLYVIAAQVKLKMYECLKFDKPFLYTYEEFVKNMNKEFH